MDSIRANNLVKAQRQLLQIDPNSSIDSWAEAVITSLRPVLQTDGVYLLGPSDGAAQGSEFRVHANPFGEAFAENLESYFWGYSEDGTTIFREEYATALHRIARGLGVQAIHDEPLFDERQRKDTMLHQEIFAPFDVLRQMAISVPGKVGETMVIAAYSDGRIPQMDSASFQNLQLLVPAFESAIRFRRLLGERAQQIANRMDTIPEAMILFGAGGIEQHRNAACLGLLEADPEQEQINRRLADFARQALSPGALHQHLQGTVISTKHALYKVRVAHDITTDSLVVSITAPLALPAEPVLRQQIGLSERETEVLARLIRGEQTKQIAFTLGISVHTVRRHIESLMAKLNTSSRATLLQAVWERVAHRSTK